MVFIKKKDKILFDGSVVKLDITEVYETSVSGSTPDRITNYVFTCF